MSHKLRSVNTKFWDDSFIQELDPEDKLIFIYLLTNTLTNMLGIYEISIKRISFDTGIKIESILKALKGFERVKKVFYIYGFIVLPNFIANQNYNTNTKKSALSLFAKLPIKIKSIFTEISDFKDINKAFESLSKALLTLSKVEVEIEVEKEIEIEVEKEVNIPELKNSDFPENSDIKISEEENKKSSAKKNSKKKIKEFVSPTHEEITEYCKQKGYNIDGEKILNYYLDEETGSWVDSKGKRVINWKQKVLGVWCKEENKIKNTLTDIQKRNSEIE